MLTPFISQKLKFWALVSMLCLVFVHGYNLHDRYLQPFTTVQEPLTFTAYIQYFFSNGIFRFRIPLLFCISGYLMVLKISTTTYKKIVSKRFKTLLIPCFIWSAIGFAFTYVLTLIPYTNNIVVESGMLWFDDKTQYLNQYKWWMILIRLTLYPFGYHLWFLRTLFILIVSYPVISWLINKHVYNIIFMVIVGLMWLLEMNFLPISAEGLLFFALGIYVGQEKYDIQQPKNWMKPILWGSLFILSAAIKTVFAFYVTTRLGSLAMVLLHKTCIISGLIFCWYYSNGLVYWAFTKKWFNSLISYTFIIYALHVPLVTYAIVWALKISHHIPYYRLLNYIFLNVAIILVCIFIGWLIKLISPRVYGLLTGGRGLA